MPDLLSRVDLSSFALSIVALSIGFSVWRFVRRAVAPAEKRLQEAESQRREALVQVATLTERDRQQSAEITRLRRRLRKYERESKP